MKAYLTGAALLSPVPPSPMTAASIGPGSALKNIPALRTAMSVVKASSLPKPIPTASKVKSPSPPVKVSPPTSPSIATSPPPAVPAISLGVVPKDTDAVRADSARSDGSTELVGSARSDTSPSQETCLSQSQGQGQGQSQSHNVHTSEKESTALPPPTAGSTVLSLTHAQPPLENTESLNADTVLPPRPYSAEFKESSAPPAAVFWPLESSISPSHLTGSVGGKEERFEVPWGKQIEEGVEVTGVGGKVIVEVGGGGGGNAVEVGVDVPVLADNETNSTVKDKEDDVIPANTSSLCATTRHLSYPLFSLKDRELDLRSVSQRSLPESEDLQTIRTYSRTQSLRILGSESLDEKLRKRLSAIEFPVGKVVAKNKGKEKLSEKEKGKDGAVRRDKEKEIEEILKERLLGVRGSR